MTEERMAEGRSSREKLDSYKAAMLWDKTAQFRAVVYARLMRRMADAFGEDVLDIAENIRREDGKYSGDLSVDIIANEKKYNEDPSVLIKEMDEYWHRMGGAWGVTCICDFNGVPEKRYHELRCVRCTYSEAFRSVNEEKIGITWCCWDMGFTSAFHPLFCQYMPLHMLKGDAVCYQIRKMADSPEEQEWLNSTRHNGWRSWK